MVGRAIAEDLAKEHSVCSFDLSKNNLDILRRSPEIQTQQIDLLKAIENLPELLKDFDLIALAVPGFMGFRCLEACIKSGKPIADISFFPESSSLLDTLAKEHSTPVIVDCGVAPGMSNLILGRFVPEFEVENFECYVGGLPKERISPWEYKAPFSPIDVIEEYIRPARFVENGKIVFKEALTDRQEINFEGIGTLEAFNTDGLRSLIYSFPHILNMKEKTLRYPGYLDKILMLKKLGFFCDKKVLADNTISALDLTSKVLIDQWKLEENDPELTVMRVIVEGKKDVESKRIVYELFDEYDTETQTSSMARTTAYTCTAMIKILEGGLIKQGGIFPPENIGSNPDLFNLVLSHLAERGVNWKRTE